MSNTLRFKPAISMQAGQFFMHYCGLLTFFQFFFSKTSFTNTIRVSNRLGSGQERRYVGPDQGPNCCEGYQQRTENYGTCTI